MLKYLDLQKIIINMKEKKEFLEQIKDASLDKEVLKAIKLEDNIEYRFKLVEEDALKRGIEQGIERGIEQGIEQGIEYNIPYNIPIDVDTIRRREPIKWTYPEGIKSLIGDTKWVF